MTAETEILAVLVNSSHAERERVLADLTVEQLAEAANLICAFIERRAAQMQREIAMKEHKPDCVRAFERSPKMRRRSGNSH